MRQATRTQWIKCTIAILLYLAFLIWVRSWYHQENTLVILEEIEESYRS